MRRLIMGILCIMVLQSCLFCASAEDWEPLTASDGWSYIGYTYGGITFAVPEDYISWQVSASDAARGYILMGGSKDFTLQLRVFQPDELTYEEFKSLIGQASSAEITTRMDGDSEILVYRNTRPNAYSELYGIAMTGLDGLFYKISIFTGDDETYDENAPVWKIAEIIGQSARHQDFSEWGIESSSEDPSDDSTSPLRDLLQLFQQ